MQNGGSVLQFSVLSDGSGFAVTFGGVPMGRYRPANSNENGLEAIVG
jgi:hypothetical protein